MKTIKIPSTASKEYQLALAIRNEVFVIEQHVPADIEVDQFEENSEHFLAILNGEAAGTGRLRIKDNYIKFERIASLKKFRGHGVGRHLMETMLQYAQENHTDLIPYMHSQVEAVPFYEKLGWVATGDVFYEANIAHRAMTFLRS